MNRYIVKYVRKSENGKHIKECCYTVDTHLICTMHEIKETIYSIKNIAPENISIKGVNVYTI